MKEWMDSEQNIDPDKTMQIQSQDKKRQILIINQNKQRTGQTSNLCATLVREEMSVFNNIAPKKIVQCCVTYFQTGRQSRCDHTQKYEY